MYRVVVKSRGKHNNVALGARYCFTKKSVAELSALFHIDECDYEVEKFVRLSDDVFCWTNSGISEKIWDKMWKIIRKSKGDNNNG